MLGSRLTNLRKAKKMTQKEVADQLHIHRSTYAQYEVDRRVPEYGTLEKIANYFDVSIDYLAGRTNDPRTSGDEGRELFLGSLDLSDDELIKKFPMYFEGMELTKDEKLEFLAIARGILSARKSLLEKK